MFILLTPVHNEEDQIDGLVHCILRSTFKPEIWMIIDDCSNDGTLAKLQVIKSASDFIKVHRITKKSDYMEFNYSEVLRTGLNQLGYLATQADYIGVLDADIRFDANYWNCLKQKLDEERSTGIVSGTLVSENNKGEYVIEPFQRIDNPRGGLRLIKGLCFSDIGGVQRSRAPDAIQNVLARLKGWKILLDENLYALSTRRTDEKMGQTTGELSRGRREYHLHKPFLIVLITVMAKAVKGNPISGLFYLKGYLSEWKIRGEQFPDDGVASYYKTQRLREWIHSLVKKLSGKPNPFRIVRSQVVPREKVFN